MMIDFCEGLKYTDSVIVDIAEATYVSYLPIEGMGSISRW